MGLRRDNESDFATSDEEDIDAVFIGRDDISDYNPDQILPQPADVIEKIRFWLQPTAYDIAGGEYRKHLSSHVAGTGTWLTSSDIYQEWLQSDEHGLLWIKGIPGSGKSVMAAKIIHDLAKSNPASPVLFFFFRQIIYANHEPRALLRDWMDQILSYSPPLQKQLLTYLEARRSLESVSEEDMWKHLRLAFASLPGKVFCVADALDEMDVGHEDFLKTLGQLGQWRPNKVKILITSRPVPRVEASLRKIPCLSLRLQETLVDIDISTYVQFALSRSNIAKSDWQVITSAVPGRANGLFLYAKLAMDAFLEPGVDINTVLSQLPTDLNALYTDLLNEHAKRSGVPESVQHLILQSVTHSTRPLRLLELAEMIRVNRPDGSTRDIKATKDLIRAACGPLLEILPDETVSVIHHSFTEYLKGTTRSDESSDAGYPVLQMGPTHERLALQCLLYLQAGCLSSVQMDTDDNLIHKSSDDWGFNSDEEEDITDVQEEEVRLRLNYPFFEYAASNWYLHIMESEAAGQGQAEVIAKLDELFEESQNMKAWLLMRWPGKSVGAQNVTKLHIAAKAGLLSYVRALLASIDVNAGDFYDRTPIWWAASEGHSEVVSILVEAGADPDRPDNLKGIKPLHMAASSNHAAAVTTLLAAGVDPLTEKTLEDPWITCGNIPSTVGDTPLRYVCNGHLEALEAFLPYIRDDISLMHRALAWATNAGSTKIVARLLEHPAVDANAIVEGETALYRACELVDAATVAVLLQAGADPNIKCEVDSGTSSRWISRDGQSAKMNCLFALCKQNHSNHRDDDRVQTVFHLLVQAGANVHFRTPINESALHVAATSPVLVRLLLEAGVDANAADDTGATPLHRVYTSSNSAITSIQLLIEQGHADINAVQAEGQTPLHAMIQTLHTEAAIQFLEYGPNCNAIDGNGNTPLHIAMQRYRSNLTTVEALLTKGADPNIANNAGATPLLLLNHTDATSSRLIDTFLQAGASINAVDRDGNTLFFRILAVPTHLHGKDSHQDLLHLIDRGLSPFLRNNYGHTALHMAVKHHQPFGAYGGPIDLTMSKLDFLIGLNLDVKAVDYSGNGLLHTLAMRRDNHDAYGGVRLIPFWEQLLALGLDLEQKNYAGRTPLHILCSFHSRRQRHKPGDIMPIDFVLSRVKNLDVSDIHGITPLHIAVTCGEAYAKKLIDAGANPLAHTHEGLTPLHLAARCRDSNTVGLLLDAMRRRQKSSDHIGDTSRLDESDDKTTTKLQTVAGVNARTFGESNTITPLFYACRSGRPESVALLLEAGADVTIGNIFEACLEFEDECGLWNQSQPPRAYGEPTYAPPLKLADLYRDDGHNPYSTGMSGLRTGDTARLEEIIAMLVNHGADISQLEHGKNKQHPGVLSAAIAKNRDYTATCLKRALGRNPTHSTDKGREELERLAEIMDSHKKDASIQALRSSKLAKAENRDQALSWDVLLRLLIRREYHLVEELANLGISFLKFPPSHGNNCGMTCLVDLGFASLIEKIGSREANIMLQKGDWHAFGDEKRPGLWLAKRDKPRYYVPFIVDAVRRELPNMDVVKLLVEKFAIDVNETDSSTQSALFYVSRSLHWWHVHQALPYLLDAGADVHTRNNKGQTPLHMALEADGNWPGPYYWDAAKILIERGADVNAVDADGRSCLACAQHDPDLVKLLIEHGATVTVDSIFAAIDSDNVQSLQALLSSGIDPNTRRDKILAPSDENQVKYMGIEPHEEFPLYFAAMKLNPLWRASDKEYQECLTRMEIVRVLLDHGADPFAKFKDIQGERGSNLSAKERMSSNTSKGHKECTLLHEVLFAGKLADAFFQLPNLDVNHRDAKGRTLLHMVCENRSGPDHIIGSHVKDSSRVLKESVHTFQRLLSLGANLKAQDYFGRNVVHYMLLGEVDIDSETFSEFLAYTLDKAPDLLNQGDENGETPLHYAMIRAVNTHKTDEAHRLLGAGADHMAVSKNGNTMLHILARGLALAAIRTLFQDLVARGIDVNTRNVNGETALFSFYSLPKPNTYWEWHLDNKFTRRQATPMLQQVGGDFFAKDHRGRGLLHAAASGDVERFQELMDLGLDPMMEDDSQQTAIDVAAACGNRDILELFEKKD